jgi:beta-phosphoglucomutase family hydrolase
MTIGVCAWMTPGQRSGERRGRFHTDRSPIRRLFVTLPQDAAPKIRPVPDDRTVVPVDRLAGMRACLFDLDGVLTRTAITHEAAWKQMFDEFLRSRDGAAATPFTPDDYDRWLDGKPRDDGVRSFLSSRGIELPDGSPDDPAGSPTVNGLGRRKNELFLEHLDDDGVEVYAGSVRFVHAVRAAGLRTAVVSSSANAAQVLDAAHIQELFDARIDGVTARTCSLRGKPAPDTFLAGAEALHTPAARSVVFEDALAGVEAGRAGAFGLVVGVDRVQHRQALLEHGADIVVEDLAELLRAP